MYLAVRVDEIFHFRVGQRHCYAALIFHISASCKAMQVENELTLKMLRLLEKVKNHFFVKDT